MEQHLNVDIYSGTVFPNNIVASNGFQTVFDGS